MLAEINLQHNCFAVSYAGKVLKYELNLNKFQEKAVNERVIQRIHRILSHY